MIPSAPDYYARHGWHDRWNYRRRPLLAYRLLSNYDLLDQVKPVGKYFLDVGCGAAASEELVLLSRRFDRRFFTDLSLDGIFQARRRYGAGSSYVVSDARHLPFREDTFDQVFSAMMFHHVEGGDDGQSRTIDEMRRVGGQALLTTTQGRQGPLLRRFKRILPKPPLYSQPRSWRWFERRGGKVSTYRLLPNAMVRGGPFGWLTVGLARWLERVISSRWAHYILVSWNSHTKPRIR